MFGYYSPAIETDPTLTSILWAGLALATFALGVRVLIWASHEKDPWPWYLTGLAGIVHGAASVGWLVTDEADAVRWWEPISAVAGVVLIFGAFWILHRKRCDC